MDDFTIAAANLALIKEVKDGLRKSLEIHDMGDIHWMLGIEVRRDCESQTISLSQRTYIDSIITRFGFEDAKP